MGLIIIGSGPAGLTASIYAAMGGVETKVIEGSIPGGHLMLAFEVENYPGFPNPISGPELVGLMRKQAERFGVEFIQGIVDGVDFTEPPFKVKVEGNLYEAASVIVATGASPRWLGLKSEERLRGKGVSSCAVCDGHFFKDKDVVVIGGGDTAVEDAIFLSKVARKVTIIHRRDRLRAARTIQDKAMRNSKISFLWSSIVEEILGNEHVEGVRVRDLSTGQTQEYRCDGVFIAIGQTPNTEIFRGQLELDEEGYIKTVGNSATSKPGIFAAGDVTDKVYRQAVVAAGSGCKAAMDALRYLDSK
ncbi:MAG: thioredoxin-disulfide reductase [Candidatus Bathyarchaeia archaeon]